MSRLGKPLRRSAMVIAVIAVWAVAAPHAGAAPLLLTSDYEVGSVSTVDTATNRVVGAPIEIGGRPKSIAITPDARTAFVVDEEGGNVFAVDLATRRVVGEPVVAGGSLGSISVSPDGKSAYVVDFSTDAILVIDTQGDRLAGQIALPAAPGAIAVAPDGATAYVTEGDAKAVQEVDLSTQQVNGPPIDIGARPQGVAVAPDGGTVYVGAERRGLAAIDTATDQVRYIPLGFAAGVTVAPDGRTAWVGDAVETVSVVSLQTRSVVKEIQVGRSPGEIAIAPSGRFAYVAVGDLFSQSIRVIDAGTLEEVASISRDGSGAGPLAITPDQSPTAVFTPPTATVGTSVPFSGAASTDPDGTVASWEWSFGDGGLADGVAVVHSFGAAGTYGTRLRVLDDEGCGEASVYTGQTAYCSGNASAAVSHPVAISPPPPRPAVPAPAPVNCPGVPHVGRVVHNRRNGTARLRVKVPAAGALYLFGKKVHAVTRRSVKAGSTFLTLHARVEVNKRLKKTHHTGVRYRVTFYPAAGCAPMTVHRSLALLRAPRHKTRR